MLSGVLHRIPRAPMRACRSEKILSKEFDYLDEAGKKLFFERMFRTTLTPEEYHRLAMIPELAPGDFRTVRQSFYYLGGERNNSERIDALARESEIKHAGRYAPKQKIGF